MAQYITAKVSLEQETTHHTNKSIFVVSLDQGFCMKHVVYAPKKLDLLYYRKFRSANAIYDLFALRKYAG